MKSFDADVIDANHQNFDETRVSRLIIGDFVTRARSTSRFE